MITNFSTSSVRTGVKRKRFWDQNAVANSFFSIATVNVGAGGVSNVEFTNIPQTYTHLQIRGIARGNTIGAVKITFNSDTASNYSFHYLYGNGSATGSSNGTSQAYAASFWSMGIPSASNTFGSSIYDILDYTNTNKYKTIRGLDGFDANGSGGIEIVSGNWRSTSAISSIKLEGSSVNFQQYSSFALYGVLA